MEPDNVTTPDLITYDEFKSAVPHLQLRTIRRLMTSGQWPKAVRFSPSGPLLWDRQTVFCHINSLMAGLEVIS